MTYPPNALIHSRRTLLAAGLAVGATASFFGADAVAAGPRKRFVLIICRGAADGLSIAPPVGDPHYVGMRRQLAITDAALPLDGDFGLHPALTSVHRLSLIHI